MQHSEKFPTHTNDGRNRCFDSLFSIPLARCSFANKNKIARLSETIKNLHRKAAKDEVCLPCAYGVALLFSFGKHFSLFQLVIA